MRWSAGGSRWQADVCEKEEVARVKLAKAIARDGI